MALMHGTAMPGRGGPGTENDGMIRVRVLAGCLIAGLLVLSVWAWLDAGREPVHPISEGVPVPEAAR